jgi:hypothetical protein
VVEEFYRAKVKKPTISLSASRKGGVFMKKKFHSRRLIERESSVKHIEYLKQATVESVLKQIVPYVTVKVVEGVEGISVRASVTIIITED